MRRTAVLLLAVAAVALPLSKSYDVVPYKNCIGTAPGGAQFGVSQFYRNTLDELTRVSVWVCDSDTHRYHVEVLDSAQPAVRIADGYGATPVGYCGWLNIDLSPDASPVRGRTYKVVVSRPTGAAISFAYDPRETTYAYGCLVVGNTVHDSWDLAARIAI